MLGAWLLFMESNILVFAKMREGCPRGVGHTCWTNFIYYVDLQVPLRTTSIHV